MDANHRRRTGFALIAFGVVVALCAAVPNAASGTAVAPSAPAGSAAPAAIGGLTWADDFSGASGSGPDGSKWAHDTGGGGWGNSELEYYTNSTSNAALDGNGDLVITARKENPAGYSCWYGSCTYTSARLNTAGKFTQAYGRFEAGCLSSRIILLSKTYLRNIWNNLAN